MTAFKTLPAFLAALTFFYCTESAQAAITTSRASNTPGILQPDRPARVSIIWNIRTDGGLTKTVEVDDGLYLINGALQPETEQDLPPQTKNSAIPANFFTFTFTETLTIPAALVSRAVKQGRPLVLRRSFSDDGFVTNTNVDAVFNFGSGLGGELEVSRVSLSFDNGATICNAKAGENVTMTARIDTEGSGTLRGRWEVRESAATSSFRTLKTVQIPVQAGRNVEIKSPAIPVDNSGKFDVRLNITDPVPDFTQPFVSCAVAGSEKFIRRYIPQGTPVQVITPAAFTPISNSTRIEWQPLDTAKAYRIEILAEKDGEPVAVQEAKGDQTGGTLSPLTLEKLNPARRYLVRVLAQ